MNNHHNSLHFKVRLGHADFQIQKLEVLDPSYKEASKLFYKLTLRKPTYFNNFNDSQLFPFGTEKLRLLDLMVFRGDRFSHTVLPGADKPVLSEAVTFSGDKVVLGDSVDIGPYRRFGTRNVIPLYSEKLLLENLIVNYFTYRVFVSPTLPNCLHQINNSKCLICDPGFYLANDHGSCEECKITYQNTLDFCGSFSHLVNKIDISKIKSVNNEFFGIDQYNLANTSNMKSKIFGFVQGNSIDYAHMRWSSLLPNLTDAKVYFVTIHLKLTFLDRKKLDLQFLTALFFDADLSKDLAINYEFDHVENLSPDLFANVRLRLTIYSHGDSKSILFDKINFLLSSPGSLNLQIDTLNDSILMYYSLDVNTFKSYLQTYKSGTYTGRVLPVSFPVNFISSNNVYLEYALFSYRTQPNSNFEPQIGHYKQSDKLLDFFRSCSLHCEACQNFYTCIKCQIGFYLSHANCRECASDCTTCVDHARKCLVCAKGNTPAGKCVLIIYF